jgi:hypothetical protein
MTRDIDRRSVLKGLGTAAVVGLAGCSSSQDETTPENESDPTGSTDGQTTTEDDEPAGPLEMEEVATGDIGHATGVNGEVVYTTEGGGQRVVYGGEESPAFDEIRRGLGETFNEYVDTDDGVAYHGINRGGGTVETVIMSGDQGLYRESIEQTSGADPAPTATLWDSVDGEAIWSEITDQKYHSGFTIGDESVDPDFDGVSAVRSIDGDVTFVGWEKGDDDRWYSQELVKGGSTAVDLSSDGETFGRNLEDVGGTPAFVKSTRDGEVLQYGDQEVGGQYTRPGDGEIRWHGELNGDLAFVATVARDVREQEGLSEFVLWHDGEEVATHESINVNVHGNQIAATDEGLAYAFREDGASKVKVGDTAEEYIIGPSWVRSIDGTAAYDIPTENGEAVLYGEEQTDSRWSLNNIFEVDGDLAYLAQTEDGVPDSDAIYQEA